MSGWKSEWSGERRRRRRRVMKRKRLKIVEREAARDSTAAAFLLHSRSFKNKFIQPSS